MPAIPGNDLDHVFSGDDMRKMMFGESSEALKRKTSMFTRLATKVGAATGASANLDLVRKATHAWMPIGNKVVIIGGELVGVELAEFLMERGRQVTVVDESPRFGRGLTLVRRLRLLSELKEHGVVLATGAQDIAISKDAVSWTDEAGNVQSAPADTVVVAKGAEGDLSLANSLESAGFKVHAIGDANGVGYIEGAMRGAAEAVRVLTT
jgi:NADPH-dependent 2,4-dienoyl-CoA reductase/sulfur reductase-like enzyme